MFCQFIFLSMILNILLYLITYFFTLFLVDDEDDEDEDDEDDPRSCFVSFDVVVSVDSGVVAVVVITLHLCKTTSKGDPFLEKDIAVPIINLEASPCPNSSTILS